MTRNDLIGELAVDVRAGANVPDREITGGYVSDLLSDVLANAREGNVWITLQIHENVVAVASMKDLAGIMVINGRQPEAGTLARAENEGIPIMVSDLSAFDLVGRLHDLGIGGGQ